MENKIGMEFVEFCDKLDGGLKLFKDEDVVDYINLYELYNEDEKEFVDKIVENYLIHENEIVLKCFDNVDSIDNLPQNIKNFFYFHLVSSQKKLSPENIYLTNFQDLLHYLNFLNNNHKPNIYNAKIKMLRLFKTENIQNITSFLKYNPNL